MKNENSPCEAFRFCRNKVPNQFPIFVMKYAYGSGNLKFGMYHILSLQSVTKFNGDSPAGSVAGYRKKQE